jgi:hypothetical protein
MNERGEQFLAGSPGEMQVGRGQRGIAGGLRHAAAHEFSFATLPYFVDFSEALRLAGMACGTYWRIRLKILDTRVRAWSSARWILFLAERILPYQGLASFSASAKLDRRG